MASGGIATFGATRAGAVSITAAIAVGLFAAAPASADFTSHDPGRARLAVGLDRAAGAATHVSGAKIAKRRLNGFDALVVRRDATLRDLHRAAPNDVREIAKGRWLIARTVFVVDGATLTLAAPAAREIRLLSTRGNFVSLVGRNGNLRFRGGSRRRLLVKSWDPRRRGVDTHLRDGRASVSVRRAARLDAYDTVFSDLGFYEGRVSGVAVTSPHGTPGGTGNIYRSRFVRNVYGAYTYMARNMKWVDNEFVRNQIYGFDPHDYSSGFLTAGNYAARNGRHGIIFSRFCNANVIRDNIAEFNGWHGIVLDDGKRGDGPSNGNEIVNNVVRSNGRVGISIDGSSRNRITGNQVDGSRYGIRLFGPSLRNHVTSNTIMHSSDYGVFVDHPSAENIIDHNRIVAATTGVRIRESRETNVFDNVFKAMNGHGIKVDGIRAGGVSGTRIVGNDIEGAGTSPVLISVTENDRVPLLNNEHHWNYHFEHDLARLLGWFIGPAFWIGLFGLAVFGPLIVRTVERR